MIFRKLELHNFLTFKGTNRIDFPEVTEDNSTLIVVLSPNNGGKTSIIKALKFLLYGETWGGGLVNSAALAEKKLGVRVEAWVAAEIVHNDTVTIFRRRLSGARRTGNQQPVEEEPTLEKIVQTSTGDKFEVDNGDVERILRSLVPEALFDFFYFQGETLANKLGHEGRGVGSALASLLHEREWKQATDAVRLARQRISEDMEALAVTNRQYQEKLRLINNLENNLADERQKSKEWAAAVQAATHDYAVQSDAILKLSTGHSFERTARELAGTIQELDRASAECNSTVRQLAGAIGASRGLMFLGHAFTRTKTVLAEMQRQNLLPADVANAFLHRLLDQKTCVCGRSLDEHADPTAYQRVVDYRNRALSEDVNSALMSLLGRLDSRDERSLETEADKFRTRLRELLEKRNALIVRTRDCEARKAILEDALKKSNHEEVKRAQELQAAALRRKEQAVQGERESASKINQFTASLKRAKEERDHVPGAAAMNQQLQQLERAKQRADQLLQLLEESLQTLKRSFHAILQRSVTEYYDSAVTDGSQGWVDKQTLLPAIRQNGHVMHNIGGGQRQLLVLAHIVSLARLRRQLHEDLATLGIAVGKLDGQSFFLDSIFAPTDDIYSGKIASFLPEKAHQIVILLAGQQWQEWTRKHLEPAATSAYYIELNSPSPPEDYQMQFRKKKIHSYQEIPKGEQAFSRIIPIN